MKIEKEKVLHISKLCKINIEDNLENYYQEFVTIMKSVDQILKAKTKKNMLITPNQNKNIFFAEVKTNKNISDFFKKTERGYLVLKRSKQ